MSLTPKQQQKKLEAKSFECIFIGYSEQSKAYRLFNPTTRKVLVSRDVTFIEAEVNPPKIKTNRSALSPKAPKTRKQCHRDSNGASSSSDSDSENESDDESSEESLNSVRLESTTASSSASTPINPSVSETRLENDAGGEQSISTNTIGEINGNRNESTRAEFSEAMDSENSSYASFLETDFEVAASELAVIPRPIPDGNGNSSTTKPMEDARNAFGLYAMLAAATEDALEPKTYQQARTGSEKKQWENAMISEYDSLLANNTWQLCDLPAGRKAIDCKWVYKVKRNATGAIERYKARLVIKGYSQVKGIDYDETYSPVARYASIRLLLAMSAKFNLIIQQMDAVTAFLQGELTEEIYMRQPEGFDDDSGKVCRLKRALYGLKQSSRVWNDKLNDVLVKKLRFERSSIDQCIYFKNSDQNTIILAVWVDDIMIFSSNATMCTKLKNELQSNFKMKDLGNVKSLLGMNVTRHSDGSISIDQSHYISTIIKRYNLEDCNTVSSPLDPNQTLSAEMSPKTDEERQEMANTPYQEAIGCIMYAAQISRPDICFAVSLLSRYNINYGRTHWTAVKRVLRYLKGTIDYRLTFRPDGNNEMLGHCDADWAGDIDKRRSTTGYVFHSQGGAIS